MLFKIKYIEKNGVLTKCRPTEINQDEQSSYENNMWKKLVLHATVTHKRPGYKYFLPKLSSNQISGSLAVLESELLEAWHCSLVGSPFCRKEPRTIKMVNHPGKSIYRCNLARTRPKRTAARPLEKKKNSEQTLTID